MCATGSLSRRTLLVDSVGAPFSCKTIGAEGINTRGTEVTGNGAGGEVPLNQHRVGVYLVSQLAAAASGPASRDGSI